MDQVILEADPAEVAGEPTVLNVLGNLNVCRGDRDNAVPQYELAAAASPRTRRAACR